MPPSVDLSYTTITDITHFVVEIGQNVQKIKGNYYFYKEISIIWEMYSNISLREPELD